MIQHKIIMVVLMMWATMTCAQGMETMSAKEQFELGYKYTNGIGVKKNLKRGLKHYKLSADQGCAKAQFNLSYIYFYGLGTLKDQKEAFKYTKLSADQGYAKAQCNLGVMYLKGQGVTPDQTEALKYFKLSAKQGNFEALSELDRLAAREALNIRMDLTKQGNLGTKNFFQKLLKKIPEVPEPFLKEASDKIDFLSQELSLMDAKYIGLWNWSEGNLGNTKVENSYKDLFGLVKNDQLKTITNSISQEINHTKTLVDHLKKEGVLITCLNRVHPSLKNVQRSVFFINEGRGIGGFLSIPEISFKKLTSNQLGNDLKTLRDLYDDCFKLVCNADEYAGPLKLNFNHALLNFWLRTIKMVDKTTNKNLWEFISCYTKAFPTDDQPEKQRAFIIDLKEYFEECHKSTHLDLEYAMALRHRIDRLIEETTPYRNAVFLKALGLSA